MVPKPSEMGNGRCSSRSLTAAASNAAISRKKNFLKKKKLDKSKNQSLKTSRSSSNEQVLSTTVRKVENVIPSSLTKKRSPLQEKLNAKLQGGWFRMLNEELYTATGQQMFNKFQDNQSAFLEVHCRTVNHNLLKCFVAVS